MTFKNWFKSLLFPFLSFVEEEEEIISDDLSFVEQIISDDLSFVEISWLPNSMIHEILLKLPIKSIIRFRSVCNSWYRLILDPYFAKLYFHANPFTAIAITQLWSYPDFCLHPVNYSFSYVADVTHNLKPAVTMETNKLIGSCNGLLCLLETPPREYFRTDSPFMLCSDNAANITASIVNPLMREFMSLPRIHGGVRLDNAVCFFGFGTTIDGDHYKIVKIAVKYGDERIIMDSRAHILTIGVDTNWRQVNDISSSLPLRGLYSHGVPLNGALHWVGTSGGTHQGVIYAFDILKEQGQCFNLPCTVELPSKINFGVCNGNLCIIDSSNECEIDIWTMKQYGVAESWSKDIVTMNSCTCLLSGNVMPIKRMRNGELLLSCSCGMLLSSDPETLNYVELETRHPRNPRLDFGYGYTPSFISPHDIISNKSSIKHLHNWDVSL